MQFLLSERNKLAVGILASWLTIHLLLLRLWPAFFAGPPGPADSIARIAFKLEVVGHIAVLGIVLTAIRNRISWWKRPNYGDDALLSLDGEEMRRGSSYEVASSNWQEVGWIATEWLLYAVLWMVVLKYSWFR